MGEITVIGLDLAKNSFHLVACDRSRKIVCKKQLRRGQVLAYFANLPRCRVGMEACASAHYWGRKLSEQGFDVKLVPPQHAKPFVRGNKNDYNDALAIAEAATHSEMRFAAIKSVAQQDIQAVHRMRRLLIGHRTALCNHIRGLMAEYGVIFPQGVATLRRRLPATLEALEEELSEFIRLSFWQSYTHLLELDEQIDSYTKQIHRWTEQSQDCGRLQAIPGFGTVVSSAFVAAIGDGGAFRRGRDVSASLGLVPKQYTTGGKARLLGISKRGDKYLRSLLIHGARSVVSRAGSKSDRLSQWINETRARRGYNKTVVALANKMARMGWAILAHGTEYRPA